MEQESWPLKAGWVSKGIWNKRERVEPTPLEMLVFAARFGLRKKAITWNIGDTFSSVLLGVNNSEDDFGEYTFPATGEDVPGQGALLSAARFVLRQSMSLAGIQPSSGRTMLLPRPRGQYNRLVYHVMAMIFEDFEKEMVARNFDMNSYVSVNESTLEGMLQDVIGDLFSDGISWGKVVSLLEFAAALAVQSFQLEMPHMLDILIASMNRIIFNQQMMQWLALHMDWVRMCSNLLFLACNSAKLRWSAHENYVISHSPKNIEGIYTFQLIYFLSIPV